MITSRKYEEKYLSTFIIWWLLLLFIQVDIVSKSGFSILIAFTDSLVSNTFICLACFVVFNNMRYYLPRQEKYRYIIALSLVLACFCLIGLRVILWSIFKYDGLYTSFLQRSSTIRFGFAFLIICFMSTVSLLWYSQKEQLQIEEHNKEIEKLATEAELSKLRQQLQPHFLFNSLNSISALTNSHPEKARYMIQQLSDFLRGTLRQEGNHLNSLQKEIEHLELYLEIEKVRFGERLQTEIYIEEAIEDWQIPALLLQPVVENAIKFGLYDTIGEVTIRIEAMKKESLIQLTIQNPYDADTAQPLHGTGFGLQSVSRRLFLLFGRNNLLQTLQKEGLFITQIIIPPIK